MMFHPGYPSLLEKPKLSMVKEVVENLQEKGLDPLSKDMSLELMIILIHGEKTRKTEITEEMVLKVDTEEIEAVPDKVTETVVLLREEMETISVNNLLEEGVETT